MVNPCPCSEQEGSLTEEDEIYSLAAMPGWLYVDTGVKTDSGDSAVTILRVEEESRAFVPAGRWTQGGELTFFNTSGE